MTLRDDDRIIAGESLPITVVIPAFQAAAFLGRALQCVASQTSTPAEVIVVDDGSTDGTGDIARRAGVRVIRQENRGVAAARNAGICAATQPWIAMLDADDTWTEDRLAVHWRALQLAPDVRWSFSDFAIERSGGASEASTLTSLSHYQSARSKLLAPGVRRLDRKTLQRLIVHRNFVSQSTVLIERSFVFEHDLFYAEHLLESDDVMVPEDLEWLLRVVRFGDALAVERVLSTYVMHPASRSAARRRQAWGVVALGELVATWPERYGDGCASAFAVERSYHERSAGLESFGVGEYSIALADLDRSLKRRLDPATLGLRLVVSMARSERGGPIVQKARSAYRRLRGVQAVTPVELPEPAGDPEPEFTGLPISVVIPAFNVERYLPIALQSVRAQTLQPAEIIVVDDGSQDGTRAVAEAAGVRVVAQPNSGLSAARNAGVAAATQPWIAFLDADDRWEPEKLERQWKAVMASPGVRFFATDSSELSELTGEIRTSRHACHAAYQFARKEGAGEGVVRIDRDSLAESLPLGQYLTPSTWLVDRDLLVSERFDCTLPSRRWCHVGEDYDWLLRALIHSDAIVVESPLTEYRVRPGSLSHSSGRTRAGDVALGKMVCSRPEAYLDGAARMFASLRARHVEIAAQEFLRVGDGVGAGIVLNALEPSARSPRWYAFRLAATMTANRWGEEAARRLRSVKRVLAR